MSMANAMAHLFPHRQHVYPVNDFRPHNTSGGKCWCNPTYDGYVVIHNALDGREDYEAGRKMQ